jgi:hypothetical protein
MSRHGYIDDFDDPLAIGRWRGRVASAIRGARGQKLLREMRDAMDAMPEKRLIAHELTNDEGEHCAMGCVAALRGLDVSTVDPEDYEAVGQLLDIAYPLACEIAYENDELPSSSDTPEGRWRWMRKWVERNLKTEAPGNAH